AASGASSSRRVCFSERDLYIGRDLEISVNRRGFDNHLVQTGCQVDAELRRSYEFPIHFLDATEQDQQGFAEPLRRLEVDCNAGGGAFDEQHLFAIIHVDVRRCNGYITGKAVNAVMYVTLHGTAID